MKRNFLDSAYDSMIQDYKDNGFDMIWTMRDNTEILIKDMEDSHIRNCINMLKRNGTNDVKKAWIDIFTDVQIKRRKLKLERIKNKLNLNL